MDDKLHFAVDLYQGTAEYYERYRLPYPEAMTKDLIARTGVSGHGRLLDLACGTGQLAFPLRRSFAEVWAVDREPDFTQMVQAKADKLGAGNIPGAWRCAGRASRNWVTRSGSGRLRRCWAGGRPRSA
jgi:ubiquinone/menaquinone biosynthesis C-methylase UbiE